MQLTARDIAAFDLFDKFATSAVMVRHVETVP
jgi:hypothetical protein